MCCFHYKPTLPLNNTSYLHWYISDCYKVSNHVIYVSKSSKSKTHDKKKWEEFLLARKRIWCHADTKTRHAAQKYYAVVMATNHTTTMSATGPGCSPWALMWFHGLCASPCVYVFMYRSVCLNTNSVAEVIWGLRLAIHLTPADLTHVIRVEDGRVMARCANTKRKSVRRDLCVCVLDLAVLCFIY